jgi:4-amino-4-deoxy-L-arabinose transferase-like glycosyltransferase
MLGLMRNLKALGTRLAILFNKHWILLVDVPLFVLIIFFHIWQIGDIPRGLYVDESSVGLNAAYIADSGHDEHGVFMPVYFRAFGEYKNPLYIYLVALVFKVFGISALTLRLTSFIFFYFFLIGFYLLIHKLFKSNKLVATYGLVTAGFLPWLFPMSRIGFEVISQITVITYALLLVYVTYHDETKSNSWFYPLLTGVVIGLSVYSYSTARLLTFLLLLALFIMYTSRKYLITNLHVFAGFVLAMVPFVSFVILNPNALLIRFKELTYILNSSLSVSKRIGMFITNYFSYLDPRFLLYTGDTNLRHHIGYGGELFIVVAVLAIIGLIWLLTASYMQHYETRYNTFLLTNLLLAPVAAALTIGDAHSLRSALLGLYVLIFSLYGFSIIVAVEKKTTRYVLCIAIFLLLALETNNYLHNYFIEYPKKSVWAFQSYDFKSSLAIALEQNPNDIVVSKYALLPYSHLEFYKRVLNVKSSIPIVVRRPVAQDKRCVIFFPFNQTIRNEDQFDNIMLSNKDDFTKVKCYFAKRFSNM